MSFGSILRFQPVYQTRVWGGRTLETRFGRELPDDRNPYGESWEISAREEADSMVVSESALKGKRLTELWADETTRNAVFGPDAPEADRFPLLCKILDAREKLSIQVHPPADVAEELGGEPKTEVWYIADAEKGAELYVGLKDGVTAGEFRSALEQGVPEDLVHVLHPERGDFIFIESGRLHAIGAGLLIYEIQQNSDTTYRVFDWNRMGLNGEPRELHIEESMKCIDFEDIEPNLGCSDSGVLCDCEHFRMEQHTLQKSGQIGQVTDGRFAIITVVEGSFETDQGELSEGEFFMIPQNESGQSVIAGDRGVGFLLTTWGSRH